MDMDLAVDIVNNNVSGWLLSTIIKEGLLTSNLIVAWVPGDSEIELVVVVQLVLAGEVRPGPVERRPGARHPAV